MSDGKESNGQTNNALLDFQGGDATLEEGAVGVGIASVGGSDSSMKDCIGINQGNISQAHLYGTILREGTSININAHQVISSLKVLGV